MQIVIDIPSPFIDHFNNDRFYDALMRLSSDAHLLAGQYEQETAAMLIKAFEKAVEIPAHGHLIDADALRSKMYHDAFETDTTLQRWDSGCWVRYKMFEDNVEEAPTIIPADKEVEDDEV